MKTKPTKAKFYNRLVIVTLSAVYLLILAGGIVRSTGSGMGCPDWPKCFGSWVPPTSADQLPANYQQVYALERVQKNDRLAGYLEQLGFANTGQALRAETIAAPEAAFNANKTWTEYINRLLGVLVGFLIMGTLVTSFKYIKAHPPIFYGSVAAFLLVVFQGWLGSVVVSTNLLPGVVTIHMLLALAMICLIIFLAYASSQKSQTSNIPQAKLIRKFLVISMVALMLQIALGTQVREAIDIIALQFNFLLRDQWVDQLGINFYVHRSFSLIIMGVSSYLYILLKRSGRSDFQFWAKVLLGLIIAEIAVGAYMVYFDIPTWAQPLHLLSSTLIVGLQFWLYLMVKQPKKI